MALRSGLNDLRLTDNPTRRSPGVPIREGETSAEWAARAGLGWDAKKTPALFDDGAGIVECPDRSVLYRSDNRSPLGVVGSNFQVVQPAEVVGFFSDLTERHGFRLTNAGTFSGGRVVWAKAETGDVMRVHGNDVLKGYVLLSTSFDGSLATTARFSTLRIVCMNGLTVGADIAPVVRVSHRSIFDADAAKVTLGVGDAFVRFQEQAEWMAATPVTDRQAIDYFLALYHSAKVEDLVGTPKLEKAADKTIERLASHFKFAPGADLRSASGTVWGLLNAVTFDVDHVAKGRTESGRDSSAMFGRGELLKNRARDLALSMVA